MSVNSSQTAARRSTLRYLFRAFHWLINRPLDGRPGDGGCCHGGNGQGSGDIDGCAAQRVRRRDPRLRLRRRDYRRATGGGERGCGRQTRHRRVRTRRRASDRHLPGVRDSRGGRTPLALESAGLHRDRPIQDHRRDPRERPRGHLADQLQRGDRARPGSVPGILAAGVPGSRRATTRGSRRARGILCASAAHAGRAALRAERPVAQGRGVHADRQKCGRADADPRHHGQRRGSGHQVRRAAATLPEPRRRRHRRQHRFEEHVDDQLPADGRALRRSDVLRHRSPAHRTDRRWPVAGDRPPHRRKRRRGPGRGHRPPRRGLRGRTRQQRDLAPLDSGRSETVDAAGQELQRQRRQLRHRLQHRHADRHTNLGDHRRPAAIRTGSAGPASPP